MNESTVQMSSLSLTSTNYYITNGSVDWVWTFCENYPRT